MIEGMVTKHAAARGKKREVDGAFNRDGSAGPELSVVLSLLLSRLLLGAGLMDSLPMHMRNVRGGPPVKQERHASSGIASAVSAANYGAAPAASANYGAAPAAANYGATPSVAISAATANYGANYGGPAQPRPLNRDKGSIHMMVLEAPLSTCTTL